MVEVGVEELLPLPLTFDEGTLWLGLLPLSFLFKEFVALLLFPEQFFDPSIEGVRFGEESIPPIPESSNIDLSEEVVGDREVR